MDHYRFDSLNSQPAYLIGPPTARRKIALKDELVFHLPIYPAFENLLYIGKQSLESWSFPLHFHNYFEMCYIAEGSGWFYLDGDYLHVAQGDIFITKPGEAHHGSASGGGKPYTMYCFGFHFEGLRSLELQLIKLDTHFIARDQQDYMHAACNRMMDEIQGSITCSEHMVQGMFMETLVHVIRLYEGQTGKAGSDRVMLSDDMRNVLTILHTDFSYIARIDDLARRVNMSRSHLDRQFRRYMRISLGEYVRELCIERAKYYLRETLDPITSISERLHFDTLQAFSTFFKRHIGGSPKEYREMIQRAEKSEEESGNREILN